MKKLEDKGQKLIFKIEEINVELTIGFYLYIEFIKCLYNVIQNILVYHLFSQLKVKERWGGGGGFSYQNHLELNECGFVFQDKRKRCPIGPSFEIL